MKIVHLHRHWISGFVGAAGACGHSSQGRRHASCSNCNWGSGRQHECRGPARADTAEGGGRCRVICRGEFAAASPMFFSPGAILGLTYVSAAGEEQFTRAASARGGRGAELQSKGKHGDNSFRLEPGNCHQLSIPHVDRIQQVGGESKHCEEGPFLVLF